jgi:hypothetical protein
MQFENVYWWQGKRYKCGPTDPVNDMIRRGFISEEQRNSYIALPYEMSIAMDDGHGRMGKTYMHAPGEFLHIIKKKAA